MLYLIDNSHAGELRVYKTIIGIDRADDRVL